MTEPPKLIIDSDWKSQAQAEKEKLAAQERERSAKQAAKAAAVGSPAGAASDPTLAAGAGGAGGGGPEGEGIPEANFDELLRLLMGQALLYMGAFPEPETGRTYVSLEMAKLHIDLLALLETKTKGNLTETEAQTLRRVVSELRMQFVEIAKAVAKAVQEGRIGRVPAGGGPGSMGPGAGMASGMGGMAGGFSQPSAGGTPTLKFPST
jgi:Domain of unknown function (DUF1844)